MKKEFILATYNEHKVQELQSILGRDYTLSSLFGLNKDIKLLETQNTFEGNALQKASMAYEALGIACIADDSGLVVDALDGAPGIFSARFAGEHATDQENLDLLMRNLEGIEAEKRTARFVCVIAVVGADGQQTFRGEVEGHIAKEQKGKQGFGYDPVFIPKGFYNTFSEMTPQQKNELSHRSKALQKLKEKPKKN